jgi:hypothetical protein
MEALAPQRHSCWGLEAHSRTPRFVFYRGGTPKAPGFTHINNHCNEFEQVFRNVDVFFVYKKVYCLVKVDE